MVRIRRVTSAVIAVCVLVSAASVAEPASRNAWAKSVDDRYFEREAANYLKFENEGQTVYCTSAKTSNEALIPHIGYARCITETNLRRKVRDWRRDRVTTAG